MAISWRAKWEWRQSARKLVSHREFIYFVYLPENECAVWCVWSACSVVSFRGRSAGGLIEGKGIISAVYCLLCICGIRPLSWCTNYFVCPVFWQTVCLINNRVARLSGDMFYCEVANTKNQNAICIYIIIRLWNVVITLSSPHWLTARSDTKQKSTTKTRKI